MVFPSPDLGFPIHGARQLGQILDRGPAGSDLSGSLWDVRAEGKRLQGSSHSLQGGLPGGQGGACPLAETPLLPLGPRFWPMVGNGFCSPPSFHRSISKHQENSSFTLAAGWKGGRTHSL